ncbi:MAG: hypothetical protein RI542_08680 [Wenzhouxiangella sp.]|jgi:hypothetical protein|nr:hypothetical protein [Wenzhouxiangella sp.]
MMGATLSQGGRSGDREKFVRAPGLIGAVAIGIATVALTTVACESAHARTSAAHPLVVADITIDRDLDRSTVHLAWTADASNPEITGYRVAIDDQVACRIEAGESLCCVVDGVDPTAKIAVAVVTQAGVGAWVGFNHLPPPRPVDTLGWAAKLFAIVVCLVTVARSIRRMPQHHAITPFGAWAARTPEHGVITRSRWCSLRQRIRVVPECPGALPPLLALDVLSRGHGVADRGSQASDESMFNQARDGSLGLGSV